MMMPEVTGALEVVSGLGHQAALRVNFLYQLGILSQYFLLFFYLLIQLIEYLLGIVKFSQHFLFFLLLCQIGLIYFLFFSFVRFLWYFCWLCICGFTEKKVVDFCKKHGLLVQQRRLFVPARNSMIALMAHF